MPLFDIIKDPDRAEQAAVSVCIAHEECVEESTVEATELDNLRAVARAVDARSIPAECPMDALAESFLEKCIAAAHYSSEIPFVYDAALLEDFHGYLRIVSVTLLTGSWHCVLSGRESALATVRALLSRGFGGPTHKFIRVDDAWELRIRFCF